MRPSWPRRSARRPHDSDELFQRLREAPAFPFGRRAAFEIQQDLSNATRRLLRATIVSGAERHAVFIKQFLPSDGSPAQHERQQRYFQSECTRSAQARAALAHEASLRASRVLVSLPDRLVVVTAAESGVSLEQVFRRLVVSRRGEAVQETAAALARVGRWTRAFQDGVPVRNPAARRDQREYLDVRLRRLVAALNGRFTEAHRRALLERFEAYASRVDGDDRRAVAVHADLCPANILVRPDAVTVLDFGMSADDVRFTDLAHLDSHLQRLGRRWRLPPRIVETLERALLTAYDPSFDTSHPLFRLLLLQHLVCQMTECAEAAAGPWPFLHARLVQHRVSTAMSLAVAL